MKTIWKLIFETKFNFFKPKKSKILIIDYKTGKILERYLKKNSFQYFYIRKEFLNFYILFKSIFKINGNRLSFEYLKNYIDATEPEYVITLNDVDINFWFLKSFYPKIKFILIQDNVKPDKGFFSYATALKKTSLKIKDKGTVDYLLLYGKSMQKIYKKYVKFKKSYVVGSLRNNQYGNYKSKPKKEIIFISQYKNWGNLKLPHKSKKQIDAGSFYYEIDKYIINFLINFCNKNKLRFKILLKEKSIKSINYEKKYFQRIDKAFSNFVTAENLKDTYKVIGENNNFVTIDSTLGYEAFARKKRVAFLGIRENYDKDSNVSFPSIGWLVEKKEIGPFWTNSYHVEDLVKVMNFLVKGSEKQWSLFHKNLSNKITEYSYNNLLLKKFINELNLK